MPVHLGKPASRISICPDTESDATNYLIWISSLGIVAKESQIQWRSDPCDKPNNCEGPQPEGLIRTALFSQNELCGPCVKCDNFCWDILRDAFAVFFQFLLPCVSPRSHIGGATRSFL